MISPPDSVSFGFSDIAPEDKPGLVRGVFEQVAKNYDLMNDVMSLGIHRIWKDICALRLNPQPGETIIDCAGGTGDMAHRLLNLANAAQARREKRQFHKGLERQTAKKTHILVADYNASMIAEGIEKYGTGDLSWIVGDAERLPLVSGLADAYVISFGIRNVTHLDKALKEARRVLKPGGRFFCLEFSKPSQIILRKIYDAYSFQLIPLLGETIANDRKSYQYLVESIRRFPDQATFAGKISEAGFTHVGVTNYSGGIVALHQALAL